MALAFVCPHNLWLQGLLQVIPSKVPFWDCASCSHHGHQEAVQGFQIRRLHQCSLAIGDEEWQVLLGTQNDFEDIAPGQIQACPHFQQLPCFAQEWDWVLCHAREDRCAPLPWWQQWAWHCLWTVLSRELPLYHWPWRLRHHPQPPRPRVRAQQHSQPSLRSMQKEKPCPKECSGCQGIVHLQLMNIPVCSSIWVSVCTIHCQIFRYLIWRFCLL